MLVNRFNSWKKSYQLRKKYCTMSRLPFYDIAGKYLPLDVESIIVDIGAGDGSFAEYLDLASKYTNLYLLDGNSIAIRKLKNNFKNCVLYEAPKRLPFGNSTVSYVHCSHLIEHFYYQDLYEFIKEVDRVLNKDGIFVVSTPMLWDNFYSDLSHVKPYNPEVLISYLCGSSNIRSAKIISEEYSVLELVYKYRSLRFGEDWGSHSAVIDLIIQSTKKIVSKLGLKKYVKNGYTLVLKK